jgi:hypothetical protein
MKNVVDQWVPVGMSLGGYCTDSWRAIRDISLRLLWLASEGVTASGNSRHLVRGFKTPDDPLPWNLYPQLFPYEYSEGACHLETTPFLRGVLIDPDSFNDPPCDWICDVNDRVRSTSVVHVGRVLEPSSLITLQRGRFTIQKACVKFAHEQELFILMVQKAESYSFKNYGRGPGGSLNGTPFPSLRRVKLFSWPA